jgi:nicotinate phosphoribosyltransferase
MNALLTDLYELTMAAGYFEAGMHRDIATFEMSIRRLPKNRGFVLACGIPQAVAYLGDLRFAREEIEYLGSLPQFARVRPEFFDFLAELRFTGEVRAVAEGTPVFPGEPLMTVRAPIIEAQIAETYLLSIVAFQSMVATKAARVVAAAEGRSVVEFGTRRAHSPEAGVLAGRAAYIGGCIGTSNVLTGFRYGVPVYGTAAHSWVQAFPSEMESYRRLQTLLGEGTIYLIDTYDTVEGARKAAALGRPLWGVRLDSGDLAALSREVRGILDRAGLTDAKIMASGDLDEYRIRALVRDGAPIDAFGVGTELATSADAPSLPAVYKLVEIETNGSTRYTTKLSTDKLVMPGGKQIWRYADHDCITRWDERIEDGEARPLVNRIMAAGELTGPLADERAAREYAARSLAGLPEGCRMHEQPQEFGVEYSASLRRLLEEARRGI